MKNKIKNLPYPFYAFLLALLTYLLFLAGYGVLGFGNRTILRGDLYAQYTDFISMYLRALKGDESFWYSFSVYLGSGTILNHAYYCFSPFNLLYLLDFIPIPAMTAVIIGLKFALSAASFCFFCNRVLKRRDLFVLIFSLCYAFNSFSLTFHFNMVWLDTLYMLPLIIWLIFELVDKKNFILLSIAWFYLFLTNFYMAYMAGIFSALVFVALIIYRLSKWDRDTFRYVLDRCFRFFISVVLGACLSAFILMPAAIFVISHLADDNTSFESLNVSIMDILNSFFIGEMPEIDNKTPLLYCGLPTLLITPFYFLHREFSLKERILNGALLIFMFLAMIFLPLFMFMHAFDYPNWYSFRFSFCTAFLLCALACRVSIYLKEIPRKALGLYAIGLAVFYSFMIGFAPLTSRSYDVTNSQKEFAINLLFILAWSILCMFYSKKIEAPRRVIPLLMTTLMITELVLNGVICMKHAGLPPLSETEYSQWYKSEKAAVDNIKASDQDFYRISINMENNNNAPSMFGYAGFDTFSTSDVYELRSALHGLGICAVNRAILENGYTPFTYMILGRKYIVDLTPADLADPDELSRLEYVPATIQKDPYALPLGYMVSHDIEDYTAGPDPFTNQETLASAMTGENVILFEKIDNDEAATSLYNIKTGSIDSHHFYERASRFSTESYISYGVPEKTGKIFYACFSQEKASEDTLAPYIVGRPEGYRETQVLTSGNILQGADATVDFPADHKCVSVYFRPDSADKSACDDIYFVYFDEAVMPDIYKELSKQPFQITDFKADHIKGTVNATADRPVLFTSIPYDDGWSAIVDGVNVECSATMNRAFLSITLTPGAHEIEFIYTAPGAKTGAALSIISLILLVVLLIIKAHNARLFAKAETK